MIVHLADYDDKMKLENNKLQSDSTVTYSSTTQLKHCPIECKHFYKQAGNTAIQYCSRFQLQLNGDYRCSHCLKSSYLEREIFAQT